jgi:hypothetical protein
VSADALSLALLAAASRTAVLRPGVGLDSCILTVRVLLSALTTGRVRSAGSTLSSRPLAVRVLVEADDKQVLVGEPSRGKGWQGHVVALIGHWLVDPSIDQAGPVLGCAVPSPIVQRVDDHFLHGGRMACERGRVSYCYDAIPGNDGFLHTPAWNDPDWLTLVELVERRLVAASVA